MAERERSCDEPSCFEVSYANEEPVADWQRAANVVINRRVVRDALKAWCACRVVAATDIVRLRVVPSSKASNLNGVHSEAHALTMSCGDAWAAIQEGRPSGSEIGDDPLFPVTP